MREALREAVELLEDERSDSEAWRAVAKRLQVRAQLLSSAIYCAREWAEPDDARRDDENRTLDDRRRLLWRLEEDA